MSFPAVAAPKDYKRRTSPTPGHTAMLGVEVDDFHMRPKIGQARIIREELGDQVLYNYESNADNSWLNTTNRELVYVNWSDVRDLVGTGVWGQRTKNFMIKQLAAELEGLGAAFVSVPVFEVEHNFYPRGEMGLPEEYSIDCSEPVSIVMMYRWAKASDVQPADHVQVGSGLE